MDRYGLCTKTSKNGIINCKAVKSKPNDIQIFGYTHEIGKGEKSPDNPYQLVSLDSGNVNLYDANNITDIQVTNDGVSRKGIIIESSHFKSKKCCIYFNLNESTGISKTSVGINIKFLYKNGQYEVFKEANFINSPKRIEIADTVEKILIYEAGSGANGRYFDLYKNLTILDTSILPTETITEEHSITLTNNNTTIQVPTPFELLSVKKTSDYIFKDENRTWKLVKNCAKYEFTGNEKFQIQSINDFGIVNFITNDLKFKNYSLCICSHLKYKQAVIAVTQTEGCYLVNTASLYLRIYQSRCPTVADFKTYLSKQYSNNTPLTLIYYTLSSETYTLSDYAQELLNSFVLEKDNIISVTDNAEFKIKGWIK